MSNDLRRTADRPCRLRVMGLLILLPLVYGLGRCSGPMLDGATREANATPVPRELPLGVERFHDAAEGATCWRAGGPGLSCLPDQWLASARAEADAP